jgi:glycosyltransferase involved in cell wall biosynthesis
MNILLIHQNYPAQFRHIAPELVKAGHSVVALRCTSKAKGISVANDNGVKIVSVPAARGSAAGIHPWLIDIESKCIRGEAILHAALQLRQEGFSPDVIWAHPGWGESLFVKKVWPAAVLKLYCEFYYQDQGADSNFDPEFDRGLPPEISQSRLLIKNVNQLLNMNQADSGLSPTAWQKSSYPESFQNKITVVHDGIDTQIVRPNSSAKFVFQSGSGQRRVLTRADKVITFVNRNLEPYRGYHVFMRSLPAILARHSTVQVVLVGGEGVSYGEAAPKGTSWAEIYRKEVFPKLTEAQKARVHFVGQIPYASYLDLLQISSVHVYLTYPFVLSWSLLESMAAGCAVLASRTGPLLDVIDDGKNGRLFEFFDVESLVDQSLYLLQNSDEAEAMGKVARSTVVERFDLKTVCLPAISNWLLGAV